MEPDRFSLQHRELGPIAIGEILPAVLARYALAGTIREDATFNPAKHAVSTVTVVEVRG